MEEKKTILSSCYGKPESLAAMMTTQPDAIVSKTILHKSVGTITLFAFDANQNLSEHTSPYDAVIQVLEGRARVTIEGEPLDVEAGQIIVLPANVPHDVAAEEPFKMLLTMIRSKDN